MKIIFCCKEMRDVWHEGNVGVDENTNSWYLVLGLTHIEDGSKKDNRHHKIRRCPFCGSRMKVTQLRKYQ